MDAFHSFWSKPNLMRSHGSIDFPEFELLTAILSALKWKEKNGSIRLITDTPGALFFKHLGMEGLWDEIDLSLDRMDPAINPFLFWAGGKLFALQQMEIPCVMLDTDLIIWETLDQLSLFDLVAAHPEGLNPLVYPHQSIFQLQDDYQFPLEWDFSIDAANTAFLYIKDRDFRDYYVHSALDFFRHVGTENVNPVTAMCFAEQRILPMCAKAKGRSMGYLLDITNPDRQSIATHTWGYKNILRQDAASRNFFCRKCIKRIEKDFPDDLSFLTRNPLLQQYCKDRRIL